MNCHSQIKTTSPALAVVRDSFQTGKPVPWVHVHVLPDFVYFDHSIHMNRGISCVECHGKMNQMDVVTQRKPHEHGLLPRLPPRRRPHTCAPNEDIFNLDSKTDRRSPRDGCGAQVRADWNIAPPAELLRLPSMKRKVEHPGALPTAS